MDLQDGFGRKHDYLRISITDRCNLRCVYCMGPQGIKLMDSKKILSYEEIIQFVKALAPWGIKKLRITGGEPLVRKGVEDLVYRLNQIPGISDIALTTNGELLEPMAEKLQVSGLKRVNISIDSLDPVKYHAITRKGDLKSALRGIEKALAIGLTPVKLNTVLMKGFNDGEIADFLNLTFREDVHVRFIEYMPLDSHDRQWSDRYLPLQAVKNKAQELGYPLESINDLVGNKTAETFRIKGAKGSIGLIHPVSNHFCHSCSRLRLTADGRFKPCLYWQEEINIREALKSPLSLETLISQSLARKRERHQMSEDYTQHLDKLETRAMAQIGG